MQPLSCTDAAKCDRRSDQEIRNELASLGAKRMILGKGASQLAEKAAGIHWNPASLLGLTTLASVFQPASSLRHDGMHIYFSNGLVQNELWLLLLALIAVCGIRFGMVAAWLLSGISTPRCFGGRATF